MTTTLGTDAEHYAAIVTQILIDAANATTWKEIFESIEDCESIIDDVEHDLIEHPYWKLVVQSVTTTRDMLIKMTNPR